MSDITSHAAGRGPVLGPMVYACSYWPLADDAEICKMGFDGAFAKLVVTFCQSTSITSPADSKALSEAKRESLFAKLVSCGRIGYVIIPLHSQFISYSMLQKMPYSLNAMSHDCAMDLVRHVLDLGVPVTKVYVDTVGDPGQYQAKLSRAFAHRIDFVVSKKADSLYKCVSAASICAKVSRDKSLRAWRFREPALEALASASLGIEQLAQEEPVNGVFEDGSDAESIGEAPGPSAKRARSAAAVDVAFHQDASNKKFDRLHPRLAGSGYPGDPLTKRWLRDNIDALFGWPSVVRFSWSTCKELVREHCVKVEWEEEQDENDQDGNGKQSKLLSFFSSNAQAPAGPHGRHKYFSARNMTSVTEL
jgi:ribonuclease H2 subunit A